MRRWENLLEGKEYIVYTLRVGRFLRQQGLRWLRGSVKLGAGGNWNMTRMGTFFREVESNKGAGGFSGKLFGEIAGR